MSKNVSSLVTLRPAVFEDSRRLWEWRNEQATREASFHTECIPFEEHAQWFASKLADPQMRIFIAVDNYGREIGYVRFDLSGGEAEISVSVDQSERGKGYGVAVIKNGSDHLLTTEPVQRIVAHIKTNNPASVVAFERAGFTFRGYTQIEGVQACEMVYGHHSSDFRRMTK
jgi:RimJ/RimL family protein N-acetyltransferase